MVVFNPFSLFAQQLANESTIVTIAGFFLVWIVLWLPIAIPLAIALKWRPLEPLKVEQKLPLVLSLYALAPALLWGIAYIQDVPFSSYGLAWELPVLVSLLIGLGLGVLGVAFLVGFERGLGWITWQQDRWMQLIRALPLTLLIGLWVSLVEELVFRGFLLNQMQHEFSLWMAAISSSLLFALLHLVWEGREAAPQLPGLWFMGMILVLARWADGGSLGLACGLHAGWIWGMASLDTAQITHITGHGPEWMTGLSGKPLAGGVGLLLLLLTGAILSALAGWMQV